LLTKLSLGLTFYHKKTRANTKDRNIRRKGSHSRAQSLFSDDNSINL